MTDETNRSQTTRFARKPLKYKPAPAKMSAAVFTDESPPRYIDPDLSTAFSRDLDVEEEGGDVVVVARRRERVIGSVRSFDGSIVESPGVESSVDNADDPLEWCSPSAINLKNSRSSFFSLPLCVTDVREFVVTESKRRRRQTCVWVR